MTNNQIRYLITVAQEGSVNRAARHLFISQSALSSAIQSVEQEFGRRIFNRTTRGVTLTEFGRQFISYITPINQQLTQLYAMRNPLAGADLPSLDIVSNGFYYLSELVAAIGERHRDTGIRIRLHEDYGGSFLDEIVSGEANLGVVRLWSCYRDSVLSRFYSMDLLYHPICMMEVGVDVSEHSPLYALPESRITPDQLEGFPIIVDESVDCGPYSDILSRLGIPANRTRYVVNSRSATYELLDRTDAFTINSRKSVPSGRLPDDAHHEKWRFLAFRDCPVQSEIGYLVPANTMLSRTAQDFLHMLQEYLVQNITPLS